MIYITGDTHGAFERLGNKTFPEQRNLTKSDCVIVCGDFGLIWSKQSDAKEKYWLDWLSDRPYTLLFVDGNHENFARLNTEFEEVEYCGGRAHRLSDSVYHLMRGQVFTFEDRRFFTFGGAASHDIKDGILDPESFPSYSIFRSEYRWWKKMGKVFRVKGVSWWPEELPNEAELETGRRSLKAVNYDVDYVITHCLPQSVADELTGSEYQPDILTNYFDGLLKNGLQFKCWYCGHYHCEVTLNERYSVLYEGMERVL